MRTLLFPIFAVLLMSAFGLTACGGGPASPEATPIPAPSGDAVAGQELFVGTCSACHGVGGEGVPNLGKDMTVSEFIVSKSDDELVEFIKVGRAPDDPLNTTRCGHAAQRR